MTRQMAAEAQERIPAHASAAGPTGGASANVIFNDLRTVQSDTLIPTVTGSAIAEIVSAAGNSATVQLRESPNGATTDQDWSSETIRVSGFGF